MEYIKGYDMKCYKDWCKKTIGYHCPICHKHKMNLYFHGEIKVCLPCIRKLVKGGYHGE
jgi:hypothetical protein